MSGLRFLREMLRKDDPLREFSWTCRNHFIGLIVFAFGWLAVTAPRYSASMERWGDPRFTYPGAWMWMDDYKDCYTWMGAHPDKASLEAIPPAEKPSFSNYHKSHTPEQIKARLVEGITDKVTRLIDPKIVKIKKDGSFAGWKVVLDRRGWYLAGLGVIVLGAALVVWSRRKAVDRFGLKVGEGAWAATIFSLGCVAGYSLLYGWYGNIGRGERFMLSLFFPVVFCLVWASEHLMTLARMRQASRWTTWVYEGCLWLLNAAILWRVVEILRMPVFDPATM